MEFNATLLDAMYGVGDHADSLCIEHVWRPLGKPCLARNSCIPSDPETRAHYEGVMAEGLIGAVSSSMQAMLFISELAQGQ